MWKFVDLMTAIDAYRKLVYDNRIEEIITISTSTLLGSFILSNLITLSLCMIKLITFRRIQMYIKESNTY